ncbi:D-glycero-alpha-D-manno-heptose-1,7-bisphosphate 7-phosphatase [Tunicatimonas pelagia]|uniref:D-glycero-alpha-D-manno-heptose-1,7-bisphosphate 7-phosphatase n=1 Tax=Tunicatimonas pelagia TaxID=931531 RepID=UPI0026657142|nr:HAD-IIIA family hydrolase [Tunicatimonas pelagia]WKN45866.1 HAD-IIIA family hydrolase [Tunicatimonas pelagia]
MATTQKSICVFLDRDGVINRDRVNYAYELENFKILPGVPVALRMLRDAGFHRIVITNQSGIAKGVYTRQHMQACHDFMQMTTGHLVEKIYYAPHHPSVTESLTRKPDSLMLEKAIARFNADIGQSWMIGDAERDLIPANKLGLQTIRVVRESEDRKSEAKNEIETVGQYVVADLVGAVKIIVG